MSVQLPPFIVEQARDTPWRYGEIPRFEILSRCDEATTERLALTFHRAHAQLDAVLPVRFQLAFDTPQALLFYDQKLWPVAEQEAVLATLRRNSAAFGNLPEPHAAGSHFLTSLMLADADTIATFAIVAKARVNLDAYLTAAYVKNLLESRTPALPDWLTAGFLRLYDRMEFQDELVRLGPKRWTIGGASSPTQGTSSQVVLLPFPEFLAGQTLRSDFDRDDWLEQAELVVAWGIDPSDPSRVSAFWNFVDRSAAGSGNEDTFRACFGFGFAEAVRQIAAYAANSRSATWQPDKAQWDTVATRLATSGEIARIKGDWERLEARYVRRNFPDLAPTYADLARKTVRRALDRGDRDPRLLATLGLLELDAGDQSAARELLEEATQQKLVRPRAYFEVGQLRYNYQFGRSTRNDGKFGPEQTETILAPLLTGASQAPQFAQLYELIAHVLENSTEPPSTDAIAALQRGLRSFPGNTVLRQRVEALQPVANAGR